MILRRLYILFFFFLTFFLFVKGEVIYTKSDSLIYESYINQFISQKDKSMPELLTATAMFFLDRPYAASTLEISGEEKLVVNLREFDCTTFVESCLALALTLKDVDLSFEKFCRKLTSIRYRNGNIEGYYSRLHYMTDWIFENKGHSIIQDISEKLGGKLVPKNINFMTNHSYLYKHLKNNTKNAEELRKIEKEINSRNSYMVIPVSFISNVEKNIKDGNIIVFATAIPGLDYSHTGISYWQDGELHFIHASSKEKKVVIERKTLSAYCNVSKNCTGISVLEVN